MAEPPAWTQHYVGLPFQDGGRHDSPDCYGLGRLVMMNELGIILPLYDCYRDTREPVVTATITGALRDADSPWVRVSWDARQPFDWVVYRQGEVPGHLGIVTDRDWGLHTFRGFGSGCERFDRLIHRFHHTALGCYRHREAARLAGAA